MAEFQGAGGSRGGIATMMIARTMTRGAWGQAGLREVLLRDPLRSRLSHSLPGRDRGGGGGGGGYWAPTGRILTVESCIQPLSSSPMTTRWPRRMISCLPSYQRTIMPVSRSPGATCT